MSAVPMKQWRSFPEVSTSIAANAAADGRAVFGGVTNCVFDNLVSNTNLNAPDF